MTLTLICELIIAAAAIPFIGFIAAVWRASHNTKEHA